MVVLTPDPTNPERLVLTATITTYLDRVLIQTLSDEVEKAIRAQAIKDLGSNVQVKKLVARAATEMLLKMLQPNVKEPV